ncbi:hypothetical protein SARC_09804 [Sphaeroforma arctica JP610]|uniref:Protein kinase domain-containing protein n=1 Tax=Sphaeroforma arctica JP610 TaxID=667725 RepID=A0A0L0FLW0_9EUKA|nr:hypothetical protein SARC_09804 [Sphaeroforma arctica JP610]KNC77740.1 hypothetical protein SARC_09804 [Sphaeroforma arctica JP610]|eukprot:XP_014151642.1 hypothetical protein SARC_09804 [Sphaeroforma arctica JP610]
MFTRKPIFDGNDRIAQMTKITAMCGTPSERNWEGVSKLPDFNKFKFYSQQRDIKRLLPRMSKMRIPENGINLLDKLLILNPADRIDAEMALDHDFFWTEPFPTAPAQMPTYPDTHEMDIRRPRERESSKISNNEANRPNNSNVSHQRSGQQMGHNDQRSHGDNSRRHHNNNINNNNRHGNRKGGRDGRNHKNRNRGNNTGNNNNRGERGRSPY